ncbi:hypothetical protein OZ664_11770 [Elizabethkingia sp. HX WHF]|nr:hypothetical protein [Elizabethkingia sp. HX WHF]MDX8564678.1 hypothetical protein [Elizabethkingia sp. HX WHF]
MPNPFKNIARKIRKFYESEYEGSIIIEVDAILIVFVVITIIGVLAILFK